MLTPDAAAVAQHRLLQQKVIDQATLDLQQFWGALDLTRPERARDALMTFADHAVGTYGDLAGTLAADFYDEARSLAQAPGTFRATALGADTAAAQGATRRLAGHLWTDNPARLLPGMSAVIDRLVKGAGRSTIIQAAGREKIRFARVPQGTTCPFCLMLGSRGFVYRDAQAAGEHNDFHPHCNCAVVPSWDHKNPHLDGYDPAELLDQWEETNPDRDRLARSAQRAKDRHRTETNARARSDYAERRQTAGMPYTPRVGARNTPSLPSILMGGHEDWPDWLDPVTEERWAHILDGHGPDSTSGKPRFRRDTDIGHAIFDTITRGERLVWNDTERRTGLTVNGQHIIVPMRPNSTLTGWYVRSAFPEYD